MPVANTLTYYNMATIRAVKNITVQVPGACTVNIFITVIKKDHRIMDVY
jgi:hypothetical protein